MLESADAGGLMGYVKRAGHALWTNCPHPNLGFACSPILHKSRFLRKSQHGRVFELLFFLVIVLIVYVDVFKWLLLAMLMGFISLAQDNQTAANTAQQLHFCFGGDYVFLALLRAHTVTVAGSSSGSGARLWLGGTLSLTIRLKR